MEKINKDLTLDENKLDIINEVETEDGERNKPTPYQKLNLQESPEQPEFFYFENIDGRKIHLGSSKICVNKLMKMAFEFLCIDFQKIKSSPTPPTYAG